jgi:hypothetical protein
VINSMPGLAIVGCGMKLCDGPAQHGERSGLWWRTIDGPIIHKEAFQGCAEAGPLRACPINLRSLWKAASWRL